MQLTEKDIAFLVDKVTDEVKKRIGQPEKERDKAYGTVALIAEMIPSPKKALEHIKTEYGTDTQLYLLNGVNMDESLLHAKKVETDNDKQDLLERVAMAKEVLLISPGISTLKRLQAGNDEQFADSLILRAILWQRKVGVVLDFEPPKFKRSTLFETVVNAIDALTSMGVKVDMYQLVKSGNEGKMVLVTETEIIDAQKNGDKTVVCDESAIVTPLAVDKAKELKINIVR